ncbi:MULTISPECIES: 3-hydroxyisobutyrate dehydrogenase [Pseudonocardia]|uniref:3-hydroxyisobutyrate dehydrogenase n=2 Tax=Pseudonocardia TaxID=1847 RepID=A0A1Y2MP78_PSEAH|nr:MULTISPECIES: 3-hydroxyisobutyrate dehydrogenase [Pseudonocardia]OSY36278.1 3-hydroxyisobutyrate dehydrogenase [Pseudonocardia autotrophica]TDN73083.1 3-hydroxyisobutyrate dehydrogenase [Pseudonocardia autotrophica]BBG03803.1 3-hydroxyisobutyrate dehydrogenase [Pseudonocardia autotrophica]GEC26589.1 3-hydroxyisobutyrate dehydrogenase [Pseudonocardia saturnea]
MSVIGFVGLGNMGGPMAANLVEAGYAVRGFDLGEEAKTRATQAGVTVVASATEAAEGADVLVTMLPRGEHVRSVLLGEHGPLTALKPGGLVIDASSIDVATSRDLHAAATDRGLLVLDAPVSGGVGGATNATLTFMIGGAEEALAAARPVLEAMGTKFFHVGAAGAGQAVKACNQMVVGASLVAVSEAFVLAERLGVSNQSLFDVLSTSSGNCWALHNFTPRPGLVEGSAADNDYAPKFASALLAKDLGLAAAAAESVGVELVVGCGAQQQVDKAAAVHGHLDSSVVIKSVGVTD